MRGVWEESSKEFRVEGPVERVGSKRVRTMEGCPQCEGGAVGNGADLGWVGAGFKEGDEDVQATLLSRDK